MDENTSIRLRNLSCLIGSTPLLVIEFKFENEKRLIYAKAENLNVAGSIKDRMAFQILKRGYDRGFLETSTEIVKAQMPDFVFDEPLPICPRKVK